VLTSVPYLIVRVPESFPVNAVTKVSCLFHLTPSYLCLLVVWPFFNLRNARARHLFFRIQKIAHVKLVNFKHNNNYYYW
jgi:hypothetical protein